jgi:RNA polymerase sigma-70 factor (ECF subfamily)
MRAEPTDDELMSKVIEHDAEAFAALYDRYASAAYGLSVRMLRDALQAEDVVQDVFLTLWRNPEQYSARRGSLRSYVLTMTRNKAIDDLRAKQRHATDPDVGQISLRPASTDVEREALRGIESSALRGLLSMLPESQRTAIELTFFGELSYSETTRLQGVPMGTVKSRVRLALDRLRRHPKVSMLTTGAC